MSPYHSRLIHRPHMHCLKSYGHSHHLFTFSDHSPPFGFMSPSISGDWPAVNFPFYFLFFPALSHSIWDIPYNMSLTLLLLVAPVLE